MVPERGILPVSPLLMPCKKIEYADDETDTVGQLFWMRLPSILIGLALGAILSFVTSNFEDVIHRHVEIVYFLPFVVYMADAIGTQTQSIYTRDLKTGHACFMEYLIKELLLGVIFGGGSGAVTALITWIWFSSKEITLAVSLAMFAAVAIAPVIALLVTEALQLDHKDPAVGAGPIATVIQDTLSVLIFGFIASAVMM